MRRFDKDGAFLASMLGSVTIAFQKRPSLGNPLSQPSTIGCTVYRYMYACMYACMYVCMYVCNDFAMENILSLSRCMLEIIVSPLCLNPLTMTILHPAHPHWFNPATQAQLLWASAPPKPNDLRMAMDEQVFSVARLRVTVCACGFVSECCVSGGVEMCAYVDIVPIVKLTVYVYLHCFTSPSGWLQLNPETHEKRNNRRASFSARFRKNQCHSHLNEKTYPNSTHMEMQEKIIIQTNCI